MPLILRLLCLLSLVGPLAAKEQVVVFVVDPGWDCVESYAARVPLLKQYKIVKVMTRPGASGYCNSDHADIYKTITYSSMIPNDALATEEICPMLKNLDFHIAAVIPTFDPAVYLADRLAACLGLRGNPSVGPLAMARRDKLAMNEAVRNAGLRAVKQKVVHTWGEAQEYLSAMSPPLSASHPVIFKILQGSSSEGVQKIFSMEQAQAVFMGEVGTRSSFGDAITEILIQECLQGKEYVVDSASRDGVHKIAMVFDEDLRPGNGIFDLYFGFKVSDPKDKKIAAIIDYANKVLDATGFKNGAADMEVFWLEDEGTPCVVDLNARWTALMWEDGLNLEQAITGHDQITATMNAWLDGDAFAAMPAVPEIKQHGAIVFGNAPFTGILTANPGLAVAKALPSFFGSYNEGAFVGKTIRKNTAGDPPLTLLLADKSSAVVEADYNRLIGLENSESFFAISPSAPVASLTGLHSNGGLPLPAIAAIAVLAAALTAGFVARSRRSAKDSTEYLMLG